jgi:hypothetical protein
MGDVVMNKTQKDAARRALGLGHGHKRSYRNRCVSGIKLVHWEEMVSNGWATYERGVYYLTPTGAQLALEDGESFCQEDFPQ